MYYDDTERNKCVVREDDPLPLDEELCSFCLRPYHWFCAIAVGKLEEPAGACSVGCRDKMRPP